MQNKTFAKSEPSPKNIHHWYIEPAFRRLPGASVAYGTEFYFNVAFEMKVSRALQRNLCQINFWDSMKLKMNS